MVFSLPSASPCLFPNSNGEQITHISRSSSNPISENSRTELFDRFSSPFELRQVHAVVVKSGAPLSALSMFRVASVCALTASFGYVQQIFDQLELPSIYLWNCCLRDLGESDSPIDALLLFRQMRMHDLCPDDFTCSFALKACVRLHDISRGRAVHAFIEKLGLRSNLVLLNAMVHLYASCGQTSDAIQLFDKMSKRDVVTWNTMITQLMKMGDLNSAYQMFLRMPDRNLRSWTAIISGFQQRGRPKEAVDLFVQMEETGLKPNEVTVVAVLAACADIGALDLGIRVHEYSKSHGFTSNIQLCNTLIDMYIKCGCIEAASNVFDAMKQRTIVSWSAMIHGLAIHGEGDKALELFSSLIRTGLKPNEVTFIGLLHACSHMGLLNTGREFFTSMTRDYGIIPSIEHYGCMVDLLSRAGLLQEAHSFIEKMPIKPNSAIWGALLGGCKVHKNVQMAELAMTHLQELDPLNDGYYVVLANIYSEAKQWENTARVRKLMREKGLSKTFGSSSVTINGVVHEFVAGDETHPQSEDISKTWNELLVHMRLKGYVPNTSVVLLDVEEKEKEKYLFRHSEKLALVFGLLYAKPGETIRVFKNLRVCEDCHASLKLISEIEGREIVVRDRNRFHCFKDGSCSCRDYW